LEKKEIYLNLTLLRKNKNTTLGLLLLILSALASYLIWKNRASETTNYVDPYLEKANFAYPQIQDISHISIKRPDYPLLVFRKMGNDWIINDRYLANDETMPHLLAVLQRMSVKFIPPESMKSTILKDIRKNGIEVKLYKDQNQIIRHYYVGTDFGGGKDTPVLMAGGDQPFMLQLAGLDGSIRNRLNFGLAEWRSKIVFRENTSEIKKIKVEYPQDPKSGFTIMRFNDRFKILDNNGSEIKNKVPNQNTLSAYFDFFADIRGESNETENPQRSNISSRPKFAVIKIVSSDNLERSYSFTSAIDLMSDIKTISPNDLHPDNKYFVATPDNNFILVQQRIAGKILKSIWYFFN
jgi:hypothetical protein